MSQCVLLTPLDEPVEDLSGGPPGDVPRQVVARPVDGAEPLRLGAGAVGHEAAPGWQFNTFFGPKKQPKEWPQNHTLGAVFEPFHMALIPARKVARFY